MIEAPEKMFSAGELPPVDPDHPIDEIHQAVLHLHAIAKNLRAQRFTGGALRLDQVSSFKHLIKELIRGHWLEQIIWILYVHMIDFVRSCLIHLCSCLVFCFFVAEVDFQPGQRDHDASGLLRLPVQRQ